MLADLQTLVLVAFAALVNMPAWAMAGLAVLGAMWALAAWAVTAKAGEAQDEADWEEALRRTIEDDYRRNEE